MTMMNVWHTQCLIIRFLRFKLLTTYNIRGILKNTQLFLHRSKYYVTCINCFQYVITCYNDFGRENH